jgi:hypothetical protein
MLMHPESLFMFVASFPVIAMSLVAITVIASQLKQLIWKDKKPQGRRRRMRISARDAAMGLAFLPLGIMYRPSLVEIVKTEIRQQEDADEDGNGDPESPTKDLLRQLRRIRRGETVETLLFRIE